MARPVELTAEGLQALGGVREGRREDDLASMVTTVSNISLNHSTHSAERGSERDISEKAVKNAKARGRISLAVRFDGDAEHQAMAEVCRWGERLCRESKSPLQLGLPKPYGSPGGRRVEVVLYGSEKIARDIKKWLEGEGYFSEPRRVMYVLQEEGLQKELVVVEGMLASKKVGLVTVFRRVDGGEIRSAAAAVILYNGVFFDLLKANADGPALDAAFQDHVVFDPASGTWKVGPDYALSDWPPRTPFLLQAARMGCAKIVERLVRHYGCSVAARRTKDRGSALHLAAYYGHGDVVELLIDLGADPTLKNEYLETALGSAKTARDEYASGRFVFPKVPASGGDDFDLLTPWRDDDKRGQPFDFRSRVGDLGSWPRWDRIVGLLPDDQQAGSVNTCCTNTEETSN
jgi:hypothetical protein